MDVLIYKGKEYKLRFGWRAQYMFEAMQEALRPGETPAPFDPGKLWDLHRMLFCTLRASNLDTFTDDLEAFVDEMEAHPEQAKAWAIKLALEMKAWAEAMNTGLPEDKKKEQGGD